MTGDALTTPVSLSLVTVTTGSATKRLIANAQCLPVSDPTSGLWISAGRVTHLQVPGLCGLKEVLEHVQKNQALVHGVPTGSAPGDVWQLVTAEKYARLPGTIARTLEQFDYPSPRILMADVDVDRSAPVQIPGAPELMAHLAALWPVLHKVGYLRTYSTRSAIRSKGHPGTWLVPPSGMHVYIVTTGDVLRFRELLKIKLWCAGLAFCRFATPNKDTGVAAILERA